MFNLLLLYEPPTSLVKLARLARFPAETGRVRAGTAAEREEDRSADENVFALLENRGCRALIVDALLVRDGTSSTELCKPKPSLVRFEFKVALSVMEELAVWRRGTSKDVLLKSGEETADGVSGVP